MLKQEVVKVEGTALTVPSVRFIAVPLHSVLPAQSLKTFPAAILTKAILTLSCSIILTRFLSLHDPPTILCRLSISILEVSLVSILKHPGIS